MALRSIDFWKTMANGLRGNATYATSSYQKMMAHAPAADLGDHHQEKHTRKAVRGDFVPVYVAIGMIFLSLSLGIFTAKQQMLHSPGVRVRKKTRETIPEVEDPDRVVEEADRFVKKSFFRKLAHVQDFDGGAQYLPNPIRRDAFAYQPHAETLKSVGIDPKQH